MLYPSSPLCSRLLSSPPYPDPQTLRPPMASPPACAALPPRRWRPHRQPLLPRPPRPHHRPHLPAPSRAKAHPRYHWMEGGAHLRRARQRDDWRPPARHGAAHRPGRDLDRPPDGRPRHRWPSHPPCLFRTLRCTLRCILRIRGTRPGLRLFPPGSAGCIPVDYSTGVAHFSVSLI